MFGSKATPRPEPQTRTCRMLENRGWVDVFAAMAIGVWKCLRIPREVWNRELHLVFMTPLHTWFSEVWRLVPRVAESAFHAPALFYAVVLPWAAWFIYRAGAKVKYPDRSDVFIAVAIGVWRCLQIPWTTWIREFHLAFLAPFHASFLELSRLASKFVHSRGLITYLLLVFLYFWGVRNVYQGCRNLEAASAALLVDCALHPAIAIWLGRPRLWGFFHEWLWFVWLLAAFVYFVFLLIRIGGRNVFGTFSGVTSSIRAARTFHPDGTVILGTCSAIDLSANESLGRQLAGPVLLRGGSGIASRFARQFPAFLNTANLAMRFEPEAGGRFDLLVLSAGTRVFTFLPELFCRIDPFDYFRNYYGAWIPYTAPDTDIDYDFYFRLRSEGFDRNAPTPRAWYTWADREEALRNVVSAPNKRVLLIEVKRTGFVADIFRTWLRPFAFGEWKPIARITLKEIADINQQNLAFEPFKGGCGFVPHGFLTWMRRRVYPASFRARPKSDAERARLRELSWGERFGRYIDEAGNGQPQAKTLAQG